MVMELVPGGSVDQYLEKKGAKFGVNARLQILLEAASGLDYLHSKDFLHRDIACRNMLIDKVVKVADFGMSRKSTNYKVDPNKPMNLRWLAPEVYETSIVNKSTDVYAYGVTMYECFTVPYSIPYADWKPNKVFI
jgi:serine/threonine protein kinase